MRWLRSSLVLATGLALGFWAASAREELVYRLEAWRLPGVEQLLRAPKAEARAWLPRYARVAALELARLEAGELTGPCAVTRVIDGDTVDVACGGRRDRVRLLNIDAPERREAFHRDASAALAALVEGRAIHLAFERPGVPSRGGYDRLLAYLYDDAGRNLNLELVRLGWSDLYTKYGEGRFPRAFEHARLDAEMAGRGIWQGGGRGDQAPARVSSVDRSRAPVFPPASRRAPPAEDFWQRAGAAR